jgi:hypothetical protein
MDAAPDNNAVLRFAIAEARLRGAPLRVITSQQSQSGHVPDGNRLAQAQIDRWTRLYPDVAVEPVVVHGSVAQYVADNAELIQLFVSGIRDRRSLGHPGDTLGCSVLTVDGTEQHSGRAGFG